MKKNSILLCCIFCLLISILGCKDEQLERLHMTAEHGDTDAQYLLGKMYAKGGSVRKDEDKATYWYKKAFSGYQTIAEQGNPAAQLTLGLMYLKGDGISKDDIKAFQWFQKSASLENIEAQYHLANMYAGGRGVTRDIDKAISLYKMAVERGSTDAQYELDMIASQNKTNLSYYEDGQLKSETPYKDGKIHGIVNYYKKNGSISQSVEFKDGQKNGQTIAYSTNGEVSIRIWYGNDKAFHGECYKEKDFLDMTYNEQIMASSYGQKIHAKKDLTKAQLLNWENGHSISCY